MTKFILSIWFVISTLAIFGFSSAGKSEFDPDMQLSQAIMSTKFEQHLIETIYSHINLSTHGKRTNHSPKGYLINIIQGDCYCEWLSQRHQSNLNQWAKHADFISIDININDLMDLSEYVPSTPAILALDKNKNLIYFGPYSRGAGCFAASGQVDELLSNYINTLQTTRQSDASNYSNKVEIDEQPLFEQLTGIIETDARGCYCATSKI